MGGEVIRVSGNNASLLMIPRGVQADAGEPLRPRQQPLPAPLQPNQPPLNARNILALLFDMAADMEMLLNRVI